MSKRDKIKDLVKKRLKEESATGTGASFTAGEGVNYATPVAGKAKNYYYKLGFKPVNKKALNKAAKGSFKSDDEVGFFFQQIQNIQTILNAFIIKNVEK